MYSLSTEVEELGQRYCIMYIIYNYEYCTLAEGSGVARGKNNEKKCSEKMILDFFSLKHPPPPMSVLKSFGTFGPAVWPAGYRQHMYLRMSCFII